ncbi:MAG: tetratricopeptide repeat protein [Chitinophagaceae bacterium]|nr:MAG: tetratricopeptide repeat protein [Chitinophagaceae bacterium]
MKRILACLAISLAVCPNLFAQPENDLVRAGIRLHDEGRFNEAIVKYDSAIQLNPDYYFGYYEKAFSLSSLGKLEESNSIIKKMLKQFPDASDNGMAYCSYGNNFDMLKQPKKALDVYDEGIKKFPGLALLHFNKGITLYNMGEGGKAYDEMCSSILLNPFHTTSHNVLRQLVQKNQVYSVMGALFFLTLESEGNRAQAAYADLEKKLSMNVTRDEKTQSININLVMPSDGKKKEPNDFHMAEMIVGLGAAANMDDKLKDETKQSRLSRTLQTMISALADGKNETGFGWEFYAPFFVALKSSEHFETWIHMITYPSGDPVNRAWVAANQTRMEDLEKWVAGYFEKK